MLNSLFEGGNGTDLGVLEQQGFKGSLCPLVPSFLRVIGIRALKMP